MSVSTVATIHGYGLLAARPAVGAVSVGSLYYATDTDLIYRNNGTTWDTLDLVAGAHTHAAADITSGTVATARLGSGTADATTFLRGDQSWAVPPGGGGGTYPKVSAYRAANQTALATGTFTKIQFASEEYDTNNNFDPTTNYRFTPTVAGKYLIIVCATWLFTTGTNFLFISGVHKNGVNVKQTRGICPVSTIAPSIPCVADIDMNGTTDYVEGYGYQGSGADASLLGGAEYTYFYAALLP